METMTKKWQLYQPQPYSMWELTTDTNHRIQLYGSKNGHRKQTKKKRRSQITQRHNYIIKHTQTHTHTHSVLTAIFPGEPGLAGCPLNSLNYTADNVRQKQRQQRQNLPKPPLTPCILLVLIVSEGRRLPLDGSNFQHQRVNNRNGTGHTIWLLNPTRLPRIDRQWSLWESECPEFTNSAKFGR